MVLWTEQSQVVLKIHKVNKQEARKLVGGNNKFTQSSISILSFCALVFVAWFCLGSIVAYLVLVELFGVNYFPSKLLIHLLWLQVILSLGAILFAKKFKCQNCKARLFKERLGTPHQDSYKIRYLNYWSSSVINTVINRVTICNVCGTKNFVA